MWNPSVFDCEYNKTWTLIIKNDIKNSSCKKCIIGKLLLECQDEILNKTETLLDDKNAAYTKSNCLIQFCR